MDVKDMEESTGKNKKKLSYIFSHEEDTLIYLQIFYVQYLISLNFHNGF